MISAGKRYGLRTSGEAHGDVYTSPEVIRFMLDSIGYTSDKDLAGVSILEPSSGTGGFLLEIHKRIIPV